MKKSLVKLFVMSWTVGLVVGCFLFDRDPDSSAVIIPVELVYQHKDTNLPCTPCGAVSPIHTWSCVKGVDLAYGTGDDCPHCSTYCAPASIAMIAKAYGKTGTRIEQDSIYENGSTAEPPGDGILDTHGVGLYESPTPAAPPYGPEVQTALQ